MHIYGSSAGRGGRGVPVFAVAQCAIMPMFVDPWGERRRIGGTLPASPAPQPPSRSLRGRLRMAGAAHPPAAENSLSFPVPPAAFPARRAPDSLFRPTWEFNGNVLIQNDKTVWLSPRYGTFDDIP
jgi:hypothetical protein